MNITEEMNAQNRDLLYRVLAAVLLWSAMMPVLAAPLSERIISADAGSTALIRAFGLGDQLVAVDMTSQQLPGQALPVIGYHRQLAAEGLLALKPTVLVGTEHMGPPETLTALTLAGVRVVALPPVTDAKTLLNGVTQLAQALGQTAAAHGAQQTLQADLSQLAMGNAATPLRAVFLLMAGHRGLREAGTGTGGDALIRLLGATNLATHASYQTVSAEALLALQPDMLLISTDGMDAAGDLLQQYPVLKTVPAAVTGRIMAVRSDSLVAGLSILTVAEALRLQPMIAAPVAAK